MALGLQLCGHEPKYWTNCHFNLITALHERGFCHQIVLYIHTLYPVGKVDMYLKSNHLIAVATFY